VRVVAFKAPEELIELLDQYVEAIGKSRSEVIRTAIVEFLKKHKRELKKLRLRCMMRGVCF